MSDQHLCKQCGANPALLNGLCRACIDPQLDNPYLANTDDGTPLVINLRPPYPYVASVMELPGDRLRLEPRIFPLDAPTNPALSLAHDTTHQLMTEAAAFYRQQTSPDGEAGTNHEPPEVLTRHTPLPLPKFLLGDHTSPDLENITTIVLHTATPAFYARVMEGDDGPYLSGITTLGATSSPLSPSSLHHALAQEALAFAKAHWNPE